MSTEPSSYNKDRAEFLALADTFRPELHRYCARLMGSVIDGEDVVQDTLLRALVALQDRETMPPLRPWLFRIAHNRALDLLRGRAFREGKPIDAALALPDPDSPNPMEILLHQEALHTAVSRFVELPILQRSVVILKDVLGETLREIADLLALSVDAVKGHLARGRARLRQINTIVVAPMHTEPVSAAVAQYVALFNRRDWDSLRALLAEDVKLLQATHPLRVGVADVGMFFTIYARIGDVKLAPAWLEGREVIAVFEGGDDATPRHIMWLEWHNGQIRFIHDYRYVGYLLTDAELVVIPQMATGA